jgi:membrane protease YdiL (CAAX protease family)
METNRIEIRTLIISMAAILCVEAVVRGVVRGSPLDPMSVLGVIRLLEIASLVLVAILWGGGLTSMGLAGSSGVHGLTRGLLWSAGFGMGALAAHLTLYAVGINGVSLIRTHLPRDSGNIALFFLVGGLVGPIAEEVFFRGVLYGFFRRWGILVALAFTTFIFVLAHPVFPSIPVTKVVGGIVFGLAYEIEENLVVPITIHALGNMAIFTLSLIS